MALPRGMVSHGALPITYFLDPQDKDAPAKAASNMQPVIPQGIRLFDAGHHQS